jgi:glycosyltransferase involved in cell wall biosynthesis
MSPSRPRVRAARKAVCAKESVLKPSLCVFLPVWNRQATLSALVSQVLEVLPDLTPRFEVVIIDDASNDATGEIAHELALLYPQVHRVVHPARWGQAAAMRTGLLHSSAEIVLYRGEACRLGLGCLAELWQAMRTHDLAAARATLHGSLGRVSAVRAARAEIAEPDLQMIHRRVLDDWRNEVDDDDWLAYCVRKNCRYLELASHQPARMAVGNPGPVFWPRPGDVAQPCAAVRRPNYLARIKAFALGE